MIYLDYVASSPIEPRVLDEFIKVSKEYIANPNSSHKLGVKSKELIDECTIKIAKILNVLPSEIIYTSGSTESNNLAIKGLLSKYANRGKHIITTKLDHSSVIGPIEEFGKDGYEIDTVSIDNNGIIDKEELKELLRKDTVLLTIPYIDNELGIKQPLADIVEILKEYPNCFLFSDATQAIGKVKVDFTGIDLVTVSPRKFYGIGGIGILIKKDNVLLNPIIHGGKSTTMYRSGTPELPLIASAAKSLEIAVESLEENNKKISKFQNDIKTFLESFSDIIINSRNDSVPNIINFSIKNINVSEFVLELEKYEIYVSTKAPCCPKNSVSRPVFALTNDKKLALGTIRISISHKTQQEELDEFYEKFKICCDKFQIR